MVKLMIEHVPKEQLEPAAAMAFRGIAKQLLTKDGIDAGCEDNNGKTLLGIAVGREDTDMVKLLVAPGDVKAVLNRQLQLDQPSTVC
ncbi:hypothetical protein BDV38DRAFT_284007 [Aspergillus pseudotamarii]|uniref:Ankyrin repeat-containing domain protein n=1 Tax=Aspergillus pseudotamarii TaxID=132259 RepID=A0A5N6SPA6_ASPPS|nr:uncharacterized protein BDV38DRAFT_284007 [Aspergillus pseudotamarii]KAE8136522.1 hypothetical protein BDV38DRAFT_284007 [Aspergillus pseudotamarii]